MGETFRCTKIRHQEAAYLYSVELREFSELGRGPWHLRLSCEKSAESFGRVISVDSRNSRNRRSGRTGIILSAIAMRTPQGLGPGPWMSGI